MNAAVTKLGQIFRPENDVPAIDLACGAKPFAHCLDIVSDTRGTPHVVDSKLVARIVDTQALGDIRPDVAQIFELALVELLENTSFYLPLQKIGGRHYHIVTGFSGKQLRLECLVSIEGIVLNFDAGFFCKVLQDFGIDVIRPIVDINDALVLRGDRCNYSQHKNYGCGKYR